MLLRGICVCSILILPTHQCHRDIGHLLWLASNNSPRSWWGWQRGAGVGCLKRWLTARQLQGKRIPKDFVHMLLNLHTEIHRHRETVVQISCCWQLKHCGTTRGVSVWLKNRVSPCYIPCTVWCNTSQYQDKETFNDKGRRNEVLQSQHRSTFANEVYTLL